MAEKESQARVSFPLRNFEREDDELLPSAFRSRLGRVLSSVIRVANHSI